MKQRISILVCFYLAVILGSCGEDGPVKVGFIGGLSGRGADLGISGRNGVMLAFEHKNASGGLNGRRLELVVRDDKQSVKSARDGIRDLISQGVELVIGPMTSSMAMAVVPIMENSGVCMLSPTVTTADLNEKDDHFIRVISSVKDYAGVSAAYQYKKLSRRKAVIIYDTDNRSYTESWLKYFQLEFETLGGEILGTASFKSGHGTVFYGRVKELLELKPDLFVIISNSVDAALICQQVRKIDSDVPIAMSEWASTERFIELSGKAGDGVWVAQFFDRNDKSPSYLDFLKSYKKRFGQEPGFAGVAGYDAGMVAIQSLENSKNGELIRDVVVRLKTFQGVQQEISIDRYGDANRQTFIARILDGHYHTIE